MKEYNVFHVSDDEWDYQNTSVKQINKLATEGWIPVSMSATINPRSYDTVYHLLCYKHDPVDDEVSL